MTFLMAFTARFLPRWWMQQQIYPLAHLPSILIYKACEFAVFSGALFLIFCWLKDLLSWEAAEGVFSLEEMSFRGDLIAPYN